MAVDLRDWRRTSAQRGWGAGWPSCTGPAGDLATVMGNNPDGSLAARVTVRKRLARLVDLLLDECERRGYELWADQCGGYNCRPIGGTRVASNHSWGVAVDLNWRLNPMRRPQTTNIPRWMVELWNRYGFAWGGTYDSTPDPMHFEFMGGPADADEMTARALRELTGGPPPAPSGTRELRRGMNGDDVAAVQRVLKTMYALYAGDLVVDEDFGPATEEAVKEFQRRSGLDVDGIVGPRTRAALRL